MAVLYPNAVVLTMEMDKARIDTAPSNAAGLAVHETYNHLGQVSNKVARYLRELGFATQAGHPLNGFARSIHQWPRPPTWEGAACTACSSPRRWAQPSE